MALPTVHLRRRALLLPALAALAVMALGLWLRWPSVQYHLTATQGVYNSFAFRTVSYSDIPSLFLRDHLRSHPRPYLDYQLEYPVGMGALIYALNVVTVLRPYFLLTTAVMMAALLVTLWLVGELPRGRRWLLALAPGLALYVNLNWDAWGLMWLLLVLWLVHRERWRWAAACLAVAVWTKFFPVVVVPLVVVLLARRRAWRALLGAGAVFAAVSAAINGPLLVAKPAAWWYFFDFNRSRGREVNWWNLLDRWHPSTALINTGSTALLALGILALVAWLWRAPLAVPAQALTLATLAACAWFFAINKIYSPQYSLWITVLLAAAGAPLPLVVAWAAADLLYWAASFTTLGLEQFEGATPWFFDHFLLPAMVVRELALLVIIGWALWLLRRSRPAEPALP